MLVIWTLQNSSPASLAGFFFLAIGTNQIIALAEKPIRERLHEHRQKQA